ncbi:uncharacterized protein MONOS_8629 [Monocercomonoides exilis]|uniref:uncharacterized protein n=1 Tax=Monocercomonoides exilis TaxID=2049356 RepID=UPI00355AB110|nr:hypothetical protein MONOS_8629 [Monocercomonoides exilis]|eukprot:MONOS_8629.1-p1 / transcript=MONOS_8629.1 / gene=MONOS_8629 / organism=Monocercomonoides_exilis_PA203 / gene_product=unspecified product / transcript_product=unspecified product / location=Mono_scaffold00330:2751-3933(-) / protein_length=374 / sequence_SO=supercontig / SO=protein_coding / is_pseudo=false
MIEEKKIAMENAIILLKRVGHCKMLKNIWDLEFVYSLLNERFEKMIIEGGKKDEGKNEKLVTDLCECYLSLGFFFSPEMFSVCVPCIIKVALKKEENEEAQKEVEIALIALSNVGFYKIEQKLYLNEIKEIIKYHQEHRNLTRLAYQSAWQFLIKRWVKDKGMKEVIVNELHFTREARREIEELKRNVDWKRKEEEKRGKKVKKVLVIERWLNAINDFLSECTLWNEEFIGLLSSIAQVYRAAKGNNEVISNKCIHSLRTASDYGVVEVDVMLKEGVVDLFSEEMKRSTLEHFTVWNCLHFFLTISERLKEEEKDETDETKRNATKMEIFEKMEEEGYEDVIISFHKMLNFLKDQYYGFGNISLNISDYFVNA